MASDLLTLTFQPRYHFFPARHFCAQALNFRAGFCPFPGSGDFALEYFFAIRRQCRTTKATPRGANAPFRQTNTAINFTLDSGDLTAQFFLRKRHLRLPRKNGFTSQARSLLGRRFSKEIVFLQ
ncbi:MAG: hypothetical protein ACK5X3_21785 [Pseudomonadota bacterium]